MNRFKTFCIVSGILLSFVSLSFAQGYCPCGLYATVHKEISERLKLTDTQRAEVTRILRKARKDRDALLTRLHEPSKTKEEIQEVRNEIQKLEEAVRAEIASVLDEPQMQEFDKIVSEVREKLDKTMEQTN